MDFDPNKPYEIVKPAEPVFDPTQPHEIIPPAADAAPAAAAGGASPAAAAPQFDPTQPHEILPAAQFDPTKPHEVISVPSPEMQAEAKRWQDPKTGALERAGMLLRNFANYNADGIKNRASLDMQAEAKRWQDPKTGALERAEMLIGGYRNYYGTKIDESSAPGKYQPTLPSIPTKPTDGAAVQVGKELYNTAAGIVNALPSSGTASMILNPAAALYAAPHFIANAWESAPKAFNAFMDPNASAGDRTRETASTVLNVLGAVGTGIAAVKGAPRIIPVPSALQATRNAAANYWRSGAVRDAMAYTRDVADNQAERAANITSNDIRGPLSRTFGDNAGKAERALSFVVESMNDRTTLQDFRNKIATSTAANPKWQSRALEAIDFADQHFQTLKPIAEKYSDTMHQQWTAERAAGHDTPFRAGYVMHAQDIADPVGFEAIASGGGDGVGNSFKKMRAYDTFADSIAAGVDPKSLNSVDLMRARLAAGQKILNRSAWVESLKDIQDPTNKQPIATAPELVTRPDGTTYMQAPDKYELETVGNRQLAVQVLYKGLFSDLTKPSQFGTDALGSIVQKANATGKSINLLFDTFHLGRIAMWDSVIKAAGVRTFKMPVPTFRQGLTLLDRSTPEITQMAAAGEVPQSWLPKLLQNKQTLDLLINRGMNVGHVADAMHQEWVRAIPAIGTFNKFVFEKFQRGAMSEIGLLEYERQRAMYPDLSDDQVARKVAKDVNTRFGQFGRQGIIKSRTMQDIARMIVLAPQWNEGLIKSELGGLQQAGASIKDAIVHQRLASGMLARGTATMLLGQFAANQLINLYTRGQPTWKNPEEGLGAKLSAWVPDKIGGGPGFFLHPAALAAEVTYFFMQRMAKDPDLQKALESYGRSRLSSIMRPVAVAATGMDTLLRPIRPGEAGKAIAAAALPTPIASGALAKGIEQVATGEHSEAFPGQFQKQLMASVGMKADNAPSPEQRIGRLAKEFNASRGVTPAAEFYPSDFQPLSEALRMGNHTDAHDALADLLNKKTPRQVLDHYRHQQTWPFTGSRAKEAQFISTLSPEQLGTYRQARHDREKLSQGAVKFLFDYLAANRAASPAAH